MRVVGEAFAAIFGHDHDLLCPVPAVAVFPHDGLENEDGARSEDDLALALSA